MSEHQCPYGWHVPHLFTEIVGDVETTGRRRGDTDRTEETITVGLVGLAPDGSLHDQCFHIDRFAAGSGSDASRLAAILNQTLFNTGFTGRFIFHNLLFDLAYLMRRFKPVKRFREHRDLCPRLWCTLALARFLKSNKIGSHIDVFKRAPHSVKYLAEQYLGVHQTSFDDATDDGNIRFSQFAKLKRYNLDDCRYTREINVAFEAELRRHNGQLEYFTNIEMPHILNVFHLNYHGVPFNQPRAIEFIGKIENSLHFASAKIFSGTGRMFNLSSQDELASAIFHNPSVTYRDPLTFEPTPLQPLYVTPESNKRKTDLDSLVELRRWITDTAKDPAIATLLGYVIKALELLRARSNVELLLAHAERGTPGDIFDGGYRIYQNNTVEAASGRTVQKRPNLLGLPKKVFKHADPSLLFGDETDDTVWSVRSLIEVPESFTISGEDINALDIVVIAEGASQFNPQSSWLTFVAKHGGHVIDPHLAVLQDLYPDKYENEAMADLPEGLKEPLKSYWAMKPGKSSVSFIHKDHHRITDRREEIALPNPKDFLSKLAILRNTYKELNLATPYLLGAVNLAIKLRSADGKNWSALQAQELLDAFYEKYPEVRAFQDYVANAVYRDGFLQCMFGRVAFPQCWDDLNQHYRQFDRHARLGEYEFILRLGGRYWYVLFETWDKHTDDLAPVVKDMKLIDSEFGLCFHRLKIATQLPPHIFRKSGRRKPGRFQRKTESNSEEVTDLALSRIQISQEIDKILSFGHSWTDEARKLRADLLHDGAYLLRERGILFYRVKLMTPSGQYPEPSSFYFKQYRPLIRAAKKFFPLYCQSVAATIAKQCLTHVRQRIEHESNTAILLFYIHDQFDVMHLPSEAGLVKTILDDGVRKSKAPFALEFSGQFEGKGKTFR